MAVLTTLCTLSHAIYFFIITVGIADLNDVITSLEKNNFPNDEWDDLGLKLGLIETKLRSIRADNRDVKGCLRGLV